MEEVGAVGRTAGCRCSVSQTATTDANWWRARRHPPGARTPVPRQRSARKRRSTRSAPAWRCRPPARRVIVPRAADPNATLPQALLEPQRELADDVAGFAKLFEEEPARYPRPPTLPVAGNTLDIAQGGHAAPEWAEAYGADGVREVDAPQPILHIWTPP